MTHAMETNVKATVEAAVEAKASVICPPDTVSSPSAIAAHPSAITHPSESAQSPLTDSSLSPPPQHSSPIQSKTVITNETSSPSNVKPFTPLTSSPACTPVSTPASTPTTSPSAATASLSPSPSPPTSASTQYKKIHSTSSSTSKPNAQSWSKPNQTPQPTCAMCISHLSHNATLRRHVARLNNRLQTSAETQRTHGQRILRAFYEQKVSEINEDHRHSITNMLNRQKKCFEDEFEVMETESRSRETALENQLEEERNRITNIVSAFERERDTLLEKTDETLDAMQIKLAQLHSRATRLEREKTHFEHAVAERNLTIESLATAAAAANVVEKRRIDMVVKSSNDERDRKNSVIKALEVELRDVRRRLSSQIEINTQLVSSVQNVQGKRTADRSKHEDALSDCRVESRIEADKLGRLIATVIQDFANSQSEVSTRSAEEGGPEVKRASTLESESTPDGDE